MNEIEFRAKDIDSGRWIYGYYVRHIDATPYPISTQAEREAFIEKHSHHYIIQDGFSDWGLPRSLLRIDIDPETLGQYTGILDKNNKKIYGGDVVLHKYRAENGRHETKVIIGTKDCPFVDCGFLTEPDNWGNIDNEIIGNIHDNSELKEKKQ